MSGAVSGKVATFVTRRRDGITQLLVFDHAGMAQLPAGSLHHGEDPAEGAAREAWEETGVEHLQLREELAAIDAMEGIDGIALLVVRAEGCPVVPGMWVDVVDSRPGFVTIACAADGWTGDVPADCITRVATRHLFHAKATVPMPDEWWVITPDGRGNQWRCHWVDLDGDEPLRDGQRRWLDLVRPRLLDATARDGDDDVAPTLGDPAMSHEEFYAPPWSGQRFLVTRQDAQMPNGATPGSSAGLCFTSAGHAVLVAADVDLGWHPPGGHIEDGETPDDALAREVAEEACARVVERELVGTREITNIATDRRLGATHWSALYWARVELDGWVPAFEIRHRKTVPPSDLHAALRWRTPGHRAFLDAAVAAEERRR